MHVTQLAPLSVLYSNYNAQSMTLYLMSKDPPSKSFIIQELSACAIIKLSKSAFLRTKVVDCLFYSESRQPLIINSQGSPLTLMLEKVNSYSIVISLVSKSNMKVGMFGSFIQVPERKSLNVVYFVPIDLLVNCVFIILNI
jgi:hypothetical protein